MDSCHVRSLNIVLRPCCASTLVPWKGSSCKGDHKNIQESKLFSLIFCRSAPKLGSLTRIKFAPVSPVELQRINFLSTKRWFAKPTKKGNRRRSETSARGGPSEPDLWERNERFELTSVVHSIITGKNQWQLRSCSLKRCLSNSDGIGVVNLFYLARWRGPLDWRSSKCKEKNWKIWKLSMHENVFSFGRNGGLFISFSQC